MIFDYIMVNRAAKYKGNARGQSRLQGSIVSGKRVIGNKKIRQQPVP
jgi:hypothetical protein